MRGARDASWIINENNKQFVGINLGSDFVAEHEWGIKELKTLLGVDESDKHIGLERRRCRKVNPECVALVKNGDVLSLIVDYKHSVQNMVENFENEDKASKSYFGTCEWKMPKDAQLLTLWSEGDFCIRVRGDDNEKKLLELHQALLNGKVAIWLGGGGIFKNSGLCLAIIEKVDKQSKEVMENADNNAAKLKAAAEKTGIKRKIDAYNEQWRKNREVETGQYCYDRPPCSYFALSPRWKGGEKSKHPVIFWLNPGLQDENEYGWFTVEDLEQWIEGKGPIPKKTQKV